MENLERGSFNQEKKLDSRIEIFNGSKQTETTEQVGFTETINRPSKLGSSLEFIKGHKLWIAGIAAVFILISSAVWGMSFYEHYLRVLSVENILPANANIVAKVTIDPEGDQFKLLEANLEKFPGYGLLKKKLDAVGEGKTVSQLIQDRVKELGLDFQSDIKSVISGQAYVVIPDAGPLGKNIQNEALLTFNNSKNSFFASLDPENDGNVVLGDSSEKAKPIPLDFIVASEIINKGKAGDVLAKLQKDNRYKITVKKSDGYTYYEVKVQEADSSNPGYLNYAVTYHALLGGNWVFASREDYMKQMVSITKKQEFFSGLFSKSVVNSLKDDADFQKVNSELNGKDGGDLAQIYYKLNFNDFFGKRNCGGSDCSGVTDYIKYPENIISGVLVHVENDGISITTDSNQTSFGDLQNVPAEKSIAQLIPEQVDGRWTDVLFEYNNIKDMYYGFKKNNLTENGLKEWNSSLAQIKETYDIDPELNFIDLIKGSSSFTLFVKKNDAPEGAAIFEISDPGKMNDTMHKLIEVIKKTQIESYSSYIAMEGQSNFGGSTDPAYAGMAKEMQKQSQELRKKYQAALDRVKNSSIQETALPEGKIYSYAIESPESGLLMPAYSITLNYSLEDGRLIFSTDYSVVQSLLASFKNGSKDLVLANNKYYAVASRYYASEMYADTYVYTQGICDSIEYFYNKFSDSISSAQNSFCDQMGGDGCDKQQEQVLEARKKWDDNLFAGLAVLRTLKLTGGYSAMADKSVKMNWFLNIVEIPKEEKARAESILERL